MIHYFLSVILKLAILYQSSLYYFDYFDEIKIPGFSMSDSAFPFELRSSNASSGFNTEQSLVFHNLFVNANVCEVLDTYLSVNYGYVFSFCKPVFKDVKATTNNYIKDGLEFVSSEDKKSHKEVKNQKRPIRMSNNAVNGNTFSFSKKLKPSSDLNNFFNENRRLYNFNKDCYNRFLIMSSNYMTEEADEAYILNDNQLSNKNIKNENENKQSMQDNVIKKQNRLTQNKLLYLVQSYLYFTFHNEVVHNSACDIEVFIDCMSISSCIPGMCSYCSEYEDFNKTKFKEYAYQIASSDQIKLKLNFESESVSARFAYGVVLMNFGHLNKSAEHFGRFVKDYKTNALALQAYAISLFRLNPKMNGNLAISILTKAILNSSSKTELYLKRAEIYFLLSKFTDSYNDLSNAISVGEKDFWYPVVFRAVVSISLGAWESAESDLRDALRLQADDPHLLMMLGHVVMQRGALRSALEIFREAGTYSTGLIDAFLRAAEVLRLLGETNKAVDLLHGLLAEKLQDEQFYSVQRLLTVVYSAAGRSSAVLQHSDICLRLRPDCQDCLYAQVVALTELGQFYPAVKTSTRLLTSFSSSPHVIRGFYLREWARYLHIHIDEPFMETNFSKAFSSDFRLRFVTGQPLQSKDAYNELPGLQPGRYDVHIPNFRELTFIQQEIVCAAKFISRIFTTDSEAVPNRERLHMSLALASIHVAQLVLNTSRPVSWLMLTDLVARYTQLGDLSTPSVFLYSLPKESLANEGLRIEYKVVRHDRPNPALAAYKNLVFQLVKTMTEHVRGPSNRPDLKHKFEKADTLHAVLKAAMDRGTYRKDDRGLVVGTQVPSTKHRDLMRHEGAYLALTEDATGAASLSVRLRLRSLRLTSYRDELETLMVKLVTDIRAGSLTSESAVSRILTVLYYAVNAAPVGPRRSASVGFSLTLGLFLASGLTARGRLPPGKVLELEPVLAGTPDAFFLVTHQWLKPGPLSRPDSIRSLAPVDSVFPSLRSILEVLAVDSDNFCNKTHI